MYAFVCASFAKVKSQRLGKMAKLQLALNTLSQWLNLRFDTLQKHMDYTMLLCPLLSRLLNLLYMTCAVKAWTIGILAWKMVT